MSNPNHSAKTNVVDSPHMVLFPNRMMVHIFYGENEIMVYLPKPFPNDMAPEVLDITGKQELRAYREIPIRNGKRHNHIVASYNPKAKFLVIQHRKRSYAVRFPAGVKEICCGGSKTTFREKNAA